MNQLIGADEYFRNLMMRDKIAANYPKLQDFLTAVYLAQQCYYAPEGYVEIDWDKYREACNDAGIDSKVLPAFYKI